MACVPSRFCPHSQETPTLTITRIAASSWQKYPNRADPGHAVQRPIQGHPPANGLWKAPRVPSILRRTKERGRIGDCRAGRRADTRHRGVWRSGVGRVLRAGDPAGRDRAGARRQDGVHHLADRQSDGPRAHAGSAAESEGRILAAYLQPQPDVTLPRFDYETQLAALTGPIRTGRKAPARCRNCACRCGCGPRAFCRG